MDTPHSPSRGSDLMVLLQELEQFEQRAQGMKTKAETQAKYGW